MASLYAEGDRLNPDAFDIAVRDSTDDLSQLLALAAKIGSRKIESTHILIALAGIESGETRRKLASLGISVEQWETGLSGCIQGTGLPPGHLTIAALDETARNTLEAAESYRVQFDQDRITEPVLLLGALENATPTVERLFRRGGIEAEVWKQEIREALTRPPLVVYEESGDKPIRLSTVAPTGRKILALMSTEAESLGYEQADPRHLLMALLTNANGILPYALHHQGVVLRKVQETLTLNLRGRAKSKRSKVPLDAKHHQPMLQEILVLSAELAIRDHKDQVSELYLLRALLTSDTIALHILEDERINLADLVSFVNRYDEPPEEEKEPTIADIEDVRKSLLGRLVGQDDAIERILPYIQRMRFGFTTPDRPIGVFLFCGQSGSGKTEMAKELARSLYGSEENLIFLEMGQFNAPESMNIFVGAPPGYIGYGEGKLTNGLRDKPRSVVLFDEVEKSHPRVQDALLRFLDEGRIDDPAGPVRDGSQCILVLTSNVGAQELSQAWQQFRDKPNRRTLIRERLRHEFERAKFRPEFLNRVDEIILFNTLTEADYAEIARRVLERDLERLRSGWNIDVAADASVTNLIGAYCARLSEGARAATRLTQSVVITPVIDYMLRENLSRPARLTVAAGCDPDDPAGEPFGIVSKEPLKEIKAWRNTTAPSE